LKFGGEILHGFSELVKNHFLLTDKIQLKEASESEFQDFLIFLKSFIVMILENLFEIIEGDQGVGFEFGTIKNFVNLGVDDQLIILLLERKIDRLLLLRTIVA
jgi:hypothetical protein